MPHVPDLAQPQLFLDDQSLADTIRVQRQWFSPLKYPEPVLAAEHPWEWPGSLLYGSVLRRQGRFQMWYCGWTRQVPPRVCYAESEDGVRWTRPALGICEFDGSRENNIMLVSPHAGGLIDGLTVIDDAEDADWPLKMLYWDSGPKTGAQPGDRGIFAARSRDGIAWEPLGCVLPGWGDRFNAVSHRVNGRYILLARAPGGPQRGRVVYRTESEDLAHWSEPELVITADAEDPPLMEIYSAMAYPAGELLIGTIERMHMSPDVLDPELIWSRDAGRTWSRSRPRDAFIPHGDGEAFDRTWISLGANAPIEIDDRLWFYYAGRSGAHYVPYPHNRSAVGLATLRREGYCAMVAREVEGQVLTKPIAWPGGDLLINADPRRDVSSHPHNITRGEVRVAVLAENGQPIDGYDAETCQPITTNAVRHRVAWGESRSLAALRGQRIQLRFTLRDAHLYAWLAEAQAHPPLS